MNIQFGDIVVGSFIDFDWYTDFKIKRRIPRLFGVNYFVDVIPKKAPKVFVTIINNIETKHYSDLLTIEYGLVRIKIDNVFLIINKPSCNVI